MIQSVRYTAGVGMLCLWNEKYWMVERGFYDFFFFFLCTQQGFRYRVQQRNIDATHA